MRSLRLLLAAILAIGLLGVSSPGASAAVDVYITPGSHSVNGRQWRTTCEPYSQVERCTASIYATQVTQDASGRFVVTTGWVFNNLTYTEAPRSLWYGNPLGDVRQGTAVAGGGMSYRWTDDKGRRWRTDCDTDVTGRNGCRTYVTATVIKTGTSAGGEPYYYRVTQEVFNNMVRFGGVLLGSVKDPGLRACIADNVTLRGTVIPTAELQRLRYLACDYRGITSLAGMPAFPNLTELYLDGNALTSVAGMPALPSLGWLGLGHNRLTSVSGLPSLPSLIELDLGRNRLSGLTGWPALPNLVRLNLAGNQLSDVSGLSGGRHTRLVQLDLAANRLPTVRPLPNLPSLTRLYLNDNALRTFDASPANLPLLERLWLQRQVNTDGTGTLESYASLAPWTGLEYLYVSGNTVDDVSPLLSLQAAGCWIDVLENNPIGTTGSQG